MGNILGEGFHPNIIEQINVRQKVYGSGFNTNRTPDEITYLNANTAWCKLVSSTYISGSLTNSPTINDLVRNEKLTGNELAKKFILFNSTATSTGQGFRSGIDISGATLPNTVYGVGGKDFGIVPMPGIQSISVKHKNRGSIRIANVKIKAFNKAQFEIVDILYLRLGFSVLLEWGNSMYFDNKKVFQKNIDNSLAKDFLNGKDYISFLGKIQDKRIASVGNYDAMFGKVTNFHWSFLPDGSYDITLDLISAGDVVESFKMNTRPTFNTPPPPDSLDGVLPRVMIESKNKHVIGQLFYELAAEIYNSPGPVSSKTISEPLPRDPKSRLKSFLLTPLDTGATKPEGENGYQFYIRLGNFLNILENKVLYQLRNTESGATPVPILQFDYDEESNLMNLLVEGYNPGNLLTVINSKGLYSQYPVEHVLHQTSYDPFICVTLQKFEDIPRKIVGYENDLNKLLQLPVGSTEGVFTLNKSLFGRNADFELKIPGDKQYTYGKIMNIFLNMEFVLNTFNSLINENTHKIPLIDFLKKILDGVNGAFGGINALDVVIDETKNIVKIIDKNPAPSPKEILEYFKLDNKTAEFSLYGYTDINKSPQASFITDFRFTTELTPEFSTMIAVGASANGQAIGEDSTALSKLNAGVYDRYKAEIIDTNLGSSPPPTVGGTSQNFSNFLQAAFSITPPGLKPASESTAGEEPKSFYQFLATLYRDNGLSLPERKWNKSFCETYKPQIQNIYRYYYKWLTNDPPTFYSGFIPFNLSLTMDGLSGMKIYQKYRVDTNFMPSNYPDSMEFLIKNIEHKIEDNKWTTILESFCVSKPSQRKSQASSGVSSAPLASDANVIIIDGDQYYDVTPTYNNSTKKQIIDTYGWPIIIKQQRNKYYGKLDGPPNNTVGNIYVPDSSYYSKYLQPFNYTSKTGKIYSYSRIHVANNDALSKILKLLDNKDLLDYTTIDANPNPRDVRPQGEKNTKGNLSGHAFGLSIDVNFAPFPQGPSGLNSYNKAIKNSSDPNHKKALVIKTIIDSGLYNWGGDFSIPDAHHFTVKPYNI